MQYLRPIATYSELRLISILRLHGIKVWSNKLLHGFYPDIWIIGTKLLIEIDGKIHKLPSVHERDKERSKILRRYGYRVLRFTNWQVEHRSDRIVLKIKEAIAKDRFKSAKRLK
jgi:very-short-patch-repair endonuclease